MFTSAIRDEEPADHAAISALIVEAFAHHPRSSHTEHFIVESLRRTNCLAVSLVAEISGAVAAHVAFSPVIVSDGSASWFGLGPISVAPIRQGQGLGQQLVAQGLKRLRALGAQGCVVLGEPGFYGRFGFACHPALRLPGAPPEFFQSLRLGIEQARGEVTYPVAFDAAG